MKSYLLKSLAAVGLIAVGGTFGFGGARGATKAPTLPAGYGSLSYRVRSGSLSNRLLYEKVHERHGRWLGTTRSTPTRGNTYEAFKPGRYKLKAYERPCRACMSLHPEVVGPKFNQCSHVFRIRKGRRTRGVLRLYRHRSCSIAIGRARVVHAQAHAAS
jgi:hypothetical protein